MHKPLCCLSPVRTFCSLLHCHSWKYPINLKNLFLKWTFFSILRRRTIWGGRLRFGVGGWVEKEGKGARFPWESWNNLAILCVKSCFPSTKSEKNINGHFRFFANKLIWLMMLAEEHQLQKHTFLQEIPRSSHKGIFMGEHKRFMLFM